MCNMLSFLVRAFAVAAQCATLQQVFSPLAALDRATLLFAEPALSKGIADEPRNRVPINNNEIGELSQHLYDTVTGIQWGEIEDKYGWTVEI